MADWWSGTQFDRGGQFYAPTFNYGPGTEIMQGGGDAGQSGTGSYTGPVNWSDPSFSNSYFNGGRLRGDNGRPGDLGNTYASTSANGPDLGGATSMQVASEMTPQMRAQTGMNNGRMYLTYNLDPKTGQWTADPTKTPQIGEARNNPGEWDANGQTLLTMAAIAATMGYGAVASAPAAGAEGAAASAAPAAYMGPGSAGAGATGEGLAAPSTLESIASGVKTANQAYQGGRAVQGAANGNYSGVGNMIGSYFGGPVGGIAGGMAGGALSTAPSGNQGGGTMPVNQTQQPVGTGDNNVNWGDIAGGVVNGLRQSSYGQDLRNPWQNNQTANAPYIQALQQSYTDPNSYLKGPEFTAINDLYNNEITRRAAAGGRLGNDIDRQVLLQKFGMQNLGNYRSGLENVINNNQHNNAPYIPGNNAGMANQYGALGAGVSAAGGATNVGRGIYNVWNQLFGSGGKGVGSDGVPVDSSVYGGGGDYSGYTTGSDTNAIPTDTGNWWDAGGDSGSWLG